MSLIRCPECSGKISEKATVCPHCGYHSYDPSLPISEQEAYEAVPVFQYDIVDWNANRGDLSIISYEDNKTINEYFSQWEYIENHLPEIASKIKAIIPEEDHYMIAKMNKHVKSLIDNGTYRFTVDKNGEILPTLRASDGSGFVSQVRLEEKAIPKDLAQSLNNISIHTQLAEILDELEYIGDTIRNIHIELQNDRYAIAEGAHDNLMLAYRCQDSNLREMALINAVQNATTAKRVLMRNFSHNYRVLIENSGKSDIQLLMTKVQEHLDLAQIAKDSLQELKYIVYQVQAECEGYAMLGEYDACNESLLMFKKFILDNNLNEKNTLRLINSYSDENLEEVVEKFSITAERISSFDNLISEGYQIYGMISD